MLTGASTMEMLEKLIVAPDTLKSHLRSIYRKAGARNRLEFVIILRDLSERNGIVVVSS